MRHSTSTPVVVAPSVTPFVAVSPVSESESPVVVPPVSESESPVVVPPVSESEPRSAPVPSTVAGVMPVDEFFRLLIVEAPAPLLGESLAGQRHIDGHRQSDNDHSESQRFQSEHRNSFFEFVSLGDCLRRRERVPHPSRSVLYPVETNQAAASIFSASFISARSSRRVNSSFSFIAIRRMSTIPSNLVKSVESASSARRISAELTRISAANLSSTRLISAPMASFTRLSSAAITCASAETACSSAASLSSMRLISVRNSRRIKSASRRASSMPRRSASILASCAMTCAVRSLISPRIASRCGERCSSKTCLICSIMAADCCSALNQCQESKLLTRLRLSVHLRHLPRRVLDDARRPRLRGRDVNRLGLRRRRRNLELSFVDRLCDGIPIDVDQSRQLPGHQSRD